MIETKMLAQLCAQAEARGCDLITLRALIEETREAVVVAALAGKILAAVAQTLARHFGIAITIIAM